MKYPKKVEKIGPVQQAACGVAHTLALGIDGLTVWSFGSGDSGKLGHGDTVKQTFPKVYTHAVTERAEGGREGGESVCERLRMIKEGPGEHREILLAV